MNRNNIGTSQLAVWILGKAQLRNRDTECASSKVFIIRRFATLESLYLNESQAPMELDQFNQYKASDDKDVREGRILNATIQICQTEGVIWVRLYAQLRHMSIRQHRA